MASLTFHIVILLFVSAKANPLGQTSVERGDTTDEPVLSLIGDIRYPDGMQTRQGLRFDRYPGSKWPNNQIPYTISSMGFTTAQKQRITDAIGRFNSKSRILKIVQRSRQSDYVMVISGNGCYSNLGRIGGQQVISLQSSGCLSYGTIQHEFIHAAGFTHENNRPDRDDHVTVLFENIPPEWRSQYVKGSSDVFGDIGKYDFYSVMHYPLNAPPGLLPGSSKPAFKILDSGIDSNRLGQRDGPTDEDIRKIDILYS